MSSDTCGAAACPRRHPWTDHKTKIHMRQYEERSKKIAALKGESVSDGEMEGLRNEGLWREFLPLKERAAERAAAFGPRGGAKKQG